MPNTRLPNSIFFMLIVLGAVQFFYYTPRLPEILGSHFGKAGSVNAWQTKTAFLSMEVAIIVLATLVSFSIPRIIAAMPVSMINLPHKEFWLSPERREDTLSYIRVWTAWLGCALLGFLLFVMELVFRANLHTPPQLNMAAFVPALLVFVAFDTIAVLQLILRFSKIQRD
ncbi:MAG: hypothetical protein JWO71_4158 [Candidatus Acidoferrum typicum]|nr:hypothetical protein [Candidatus Acidoferrum typicum]